MDEIPVLGGKGRYDQVTSPEHVWLATGLLGLGPNTVETSLGRVVLEQQYWHKTGMNFDPMLEKKFPHSPNKRIHICAQMKLCLLEYMQGCLPSIISKSE